MTDLLVGWKEISTFLRVSEKTAKRYRTRGLPVKRDPAGHPVIKKTTVDEWRKGHYSQEYNV